MLLDLTFNFNENKMKKHRLIAAILLSMLTLSGCNKDFLDRQPLDKFSSAEFWKTKKDFDIALTAIYGHLQRNIFSIETPNWDNLTDNAYGQHSYNGTQSIVTGVISPSTGGYISDVYGQCYAGIARVNIFLKQLETFQGSDIGESDKKNFAAQAKFMRAYYYFLLYACYGDVPLIKDPLTLENQIQPKTLSNDILTFVLLDLDTSIPDLPSVLYDKNNGRLVRASAQALKLRVLMYAAYGDNGVPNLNMLADARVLAQEIMNTGYRLAPQFESVFRDATQEGNPEILFSIKFLAPNNSTQMDMLYGDWLVVSPLKSLFNAFEEGDKRRDLSIFENEVNFGGNIYKPSNNKPTGYGVKKFLTPDLMPYGYSTPSQQDWVMLRYAEVLLNFAEAENELSGVTEEVKNTINSIRQRAGLKEISTTNLTKEKMREIIRKERRLELAFEGIRYFDLKRWHIAGDVLNNVKDGILTYKFEDRFYHWPLPQSEIDKSGNILVQNKDY